MCVGDVKTRARVCVCKRGFLKIHIFQHLPTSLANLNKTVEHVNHVVECNFGGFGETHTILRDLKVVH